jgi:hypothetical protein
VGDARAGRTHSSDLAGVEVDGMGKPDIGPEPAERRRVLERSASEARQAVLLFLDRLGEMGMEAKAKASCEGGRLDHQLLARREGAAGGDDNCHVTAIM